MKNAGLRATVLMSGGVDSAACAYHLHEQGLAVEGLFVNHGQAGAVPEAKAASELGHHLGIPVREVVFSGVGPTGPGELVGRNAFLIFTALFATSGRPGLIGIGLHAGTPYYDCSEGFLSAARKLVAEHSDGKVSVVAPFVRWTKLDVYRYFLSAGLPISSTYSCEAGTEPVCGACASCRDREALKC